MKQWIIVYVGYICRMLSSCSAYFQNRYLSQYIVAIACLCTLVFSTLVSPPTGLAQNQPDPNIRVDIEAGFEDAYRAGDWFPVSIEVANEGADVQGILEWSFPAGDGNDVFRQAIDLPQGSRKRVVMNVVAPDGSFVRNGRLDILSGDTLLFRQDINLEAYAADQLLVGVISSDPTLLSSLEAFQDPNYSSASILNFPPEQLPEHAQVLNTLDVLFLHDTDTFSLSPEQYEALRLWVRTDGHLVVSGGIDSTQIAPELAMLLPVEMTGGLVQGDLTGLQRAAPNAVFPAITDVALSEVQPKSQAQPFPNNADETALVYTQRLGEGKVTFTTFDIATLRGWQGDVTFWERILDPFPTGEPGTMVRMERYNVLQDALQDANFSLPSATGLLFFICLYIASIGPLTYLILRRFKRLEWAWITLPVTMLIFATTFYFIGFGLRGAQSQLYQVAIVQGFEGESQGLGTTFLGLFSPRRTRYTIEIPDTELVSKLEDWSDISNAPATIEYNDANARVADVLVDIGSVRTFINETVVDMPLQVESTLSRQGQRIQGEIQNVSDVPLNEVLLVNGDTYMRIGDLQVGESYMVDFDNNTGNPIWNISVASDEHFNRSGIVQGLLNRGILNSGVNITSDNVYLITWQDVPIISPLLDGQQITQPATSMYVIRLDA
ncbi:MAG: hypothetical protein AAGF95_11300 [Chloroflexota bacterium]